MTGQESRPQSGGETTAVRHSRFAICPAEEIPPGTRRIVRIAGRSIGVFNVKGEFFAIRNRCPHQGGPLCLGITKGLAVPEFIDGEWPELHVERAGEILRCPWHAWEFDLRSGEAVFGQGWRVAVYRTVVDEDGAGAEPVISKMESLPASGRAARSSARMHLDVPPPLERYKTTVESGTVIVDMTSPV